ncbi:MAG: bacteriohemerythrin [Burkholderiaceae bacterium]|jgi:hemerythrin-like metal-binding protein|nr:bacteriohemerythrin [Burkholderiaceae bacterium]
MAYFIWGDDLLIDNGQLDQDHRVLIEQINKLHSATKVGGGQEIVGKTLENLIRNTLEHIRREEQFMTQINYPGQKEHEADHVRFVNSLRDLQRKYGLGSITVAAQLSTLLRDWLSLHIQRYDKDIFHFMEEQKCTKRTKRTR